MIDHNDAVSVNCTFNYSCIDIKYKIPFNGSHKYITRKLKPQLKYIAFDLNMASTIHVLVPNPRGVK